MVTSPTGAKAVPSGSGTAAALSDAPPADVSQDQGFGDPSTQPLDRFSDTTDSSSGPGVGGGGFGGGSSGDGGASGSF
jgi:hypothetical protein